MSDPNVEAVIARHRQRAEAGLKKYGTDTTRTDLSFLEWLQHFQDELMDAAVYVEVIKAYITGGGDVIRDELSRLISQCDGWRRSALGLAIEAETASRLHRNASAETVRLTAELCDLKLRIAGVGRNCRDDGDVSPCKEAP